MAIREGCGTRLLHATCALLLMAQSACADRGESPVAPPPALPRHTSIYIHAHPDDWQLFMGDHVVHDVALGKKVVLVYASAGDAGHDSAYWRARERGALASVQVSTPTDGRWKCALPTINGHMITACAYENTISYFIRLPDGNNTDGGGYARYQNGSLVKLKAGRPVATVDRSADYANWPDLVRTVEMIVERESAGVDSVVVNAPEYDRARNPSDHPDHHATADLVAAFATNHDWTYFWFLDYGTFFKPINLSDGDVALKQAAFDAYDGAMVIAGYESIGGTGRYNDWLRRTYFR
jgi:LmbE family N-acetylglucosaminyl deacetylase